MMTAKKRLAQFSINSGTMGLKTDRGDFDERNGSDKLASFNPGVSL
jgi:hypothetical protein